MPSPRIHKPLLLGAILALTGMLPPSPCRAESLYGKMLTSIHIRGARFTRHETITRELTSRISQPYLEENAKKDYSRLDKLDIFSDVKIEPVAAEDGVTLEIEVVEIYPYLPFISYEVTDENGFAAGPGFQSANLFGRDILFSGSARFGGATNINFLLEDPWVAGNHLSYRLEIFQRDRANDLDRFQEKATEVYLSIGSYWGENGRFGGRLSFLSIESDSLGRTLAADDQDDIPAIGAYIGYDSRDLWSDPHSGWWNELEVSKYGGFLDADGDFWRVNVDIRRYVPIVKRHTLALFSLATFTTGDVGEEIPPHLDFHIGGTNTVRGWELDTQRGKHQFLNTAEYRVTVLEPRLVKLFGVSGDIGLQLAAYADVGIAWSDGGEFKADNFIDGYGFGVRLLLPFVTMFRFDFSLGQPGAGSDTNIGAWEKPVATRFRVR